MRSWAVTASLIILFILVSVAIILSIVALVMGNKSNYAKAFTVLEFDGAGTDNFFDLSEPTYFYYNVTSDAELRLSGKRKVIAFVSNDSQYCIKITANQDLVFKYRNKELNHYNLNSKESVIIIWSRDNLARILKN